MINGWHAVPSSSRGPGWSNFWRHKPKYVFSFFGFDMYRPPPPASSASGYEIIAVQTEGADFAPTRKVTLADPAKDAIERAKVVAA
jgi:hypothetical protein